MCNNPFYRLDVKNPAVISVLRDLPFLEKCTTRNGFIRSAHDFRTLFLYGLGEYVQEIPCGKCMDCLQNWSQQWTARCMLEASQYRSNLFITLTYDDEHVPHDTFINPVTGAVTDAMTVVKSHVQKFMKRLRRWCERNNLSSPRVFYAGEYGDRTKRPHYHLTLFNCAFPDTEYAFTKNGIKYYKSQILQRIWSCRVRDPKTKKLVAVTLGNAFFAPVTPESMKYVASYTCKNHRRKSDELTDEQIAALYSCGFEQNTVVPAATAVGLLQPNFVGFSRRPGIARGMFDLLHDTLFKFDQIPSGLCKTRRVRYYDYLFKTYYPDEWEIIKSRRPKPPPVEPPDGMSIQEYRERREQTMIAAAKLKSRDF